MREIFKVLLSPVPTLIFHGGIALIVKEGIGLALFDSLKYSILAMFSLFVMFFIVVRLRIYFKNKREMSQGHPQYYLFLLIEAIFAVCDFLFDKIYGSLLCWKLGWYLVYTYRLADLKATDRSVRGRWAAAQCRLLTWAQESKHC